MRRDVRYYDGEIDLHYDSANRQVTPALGRRLHRRPRSLSTISAYPSARCRRVQKDSLKIRADGQAVVAQARRRSPRRDRRRPGHRIHPPLDLPRPPAGKSPESNSSSTPSRIRGRSSSRRSESIWVTTQGNSARPTSSSSNRRSSTSRFLPRPSSLRCQMRRAFSTTARTDLRPKFHRVGGPIPDLVTYIRDVIDGGK